MLKSKGPQYITVRELGTLLGVSTGSFYHHFKHREDFVARLLQDWADGTERAIGTLLTSSPETLDQVNEQVNELLDHRLEAALRAWGLFDTAVAVRLETTDKRRRKVLSRMYEDHVPKPMARNLANLHLCALAGAQFMFLNNPVSLRNFGQFVNESARKLAAVGTMV